MGPAVQCVVCASCQGLRGWLKVSGLSEAPRLDDTVPECTPLCDSGRIPWYKAVSLRSLCSHTRDALYFSPRVGWRGWGRVGGAGGGGTVCWQLAVWTAIAVLKLLCPLGEVMENTMGRTLHENNRGIYYVLNQPVCHAAADSIYCTVYGMQTWHFLTYWSILFKKKPISLDSRSCLRIQLKEHYLVFLP